MNAPALRRVVLIAASLAPIVAAAEIAYTVQPHAERGVLRISMRIPVQRPEVSLQMPSWAPGSYRLTTNFRNVGAFAATDPSGKALAFDKPDDSTWRVTGADREVLVRYEVPSPLVAGASHYSGPSTYLYVVGRTAERCTVNFELPAEWQVAIGLDAVGRSTTQFAAADYDVLADNPATLGQFILLGYNVLGKPHFIAMRGAPAAEVNRQYILKACRSITEAQASFFGGLPYTKYVWHFNVNDAPDGAGGLEHLSSTQISLASGVGPRAVSVLSHEFFHLWNVKRIRSAPLGPFDYTQLPKTGALWWLEGVTDYYAHTFLHRYHWWGTDMFHKDILDNVRTVRANPQRLEVSPHDASMRVGEASNGRGNSRGFGVSYYDTGWLVGMCLDLEIRALTQGRRSLDDVVLALWQQCRDDKPGFAEDEIRKQCIRFGGAAMGPFYDQVVMKAGELPVEAQLAKVGLRISDRMETFPDPGFDWTANRADRGVRIRNVRGSAEDRLRNGDLIVEVNGQSTRHDTTRAMSEAMTGQMEKIDAQTTLVLRVVRDGKEVEVRVLPSSEIRTSRRIEDLAVVDGAMRKLREGWYFGRS